MESPKGISEEQAIALLNLSQQKGKPCVVKIKNKEIRRKPGRAILKSLSGNGKVIVRPFHHRRDEEELLSNIFLWPGAVAFDISEIANMANYHHDNKPIGEKLSVPMSVVASAIPIGEFVIFSAKMKSVWGGKNRGWVQNFNLSVKWKNYDDGMKAVDNINKVSMQNDSKLLTVEEAHEALLDVVTSPGKSMTIAEAREVLEDIEKASVTPKVNVLPFNPQPLVQKDGRNTAPESPTPAKLSVASIFSDENDEIDFNILLGKNEAPLKIAKEERMKAADEYGKAKKVAKEAFAAAEAAFEKFKQLDSKVLSLGGLSSLKDVVTKPKTEPKAESKPRAKMTLMFYDVKEILMATPGLKLDDIYKKIITVIPDADRNRLTKNLSSYKNSGWLEQDDDHNWSLTEEGRIKQPSK